MKTDAEKRSRLARLGSHLRSHVVAYMALGVALTMTPLPAHAGHLVVRTSDIVNGAVTTPKIRNSAVTAAKIKNSAVTAAKIKNKAVGFRHLNVTEVQGQTEIFNGQRGFAFAACPGKTVPLSGGAAALDPTGFPAAGWSLGASVPARDNGAGWYAEGLNQSGGPVALIVVAYCVRT